MGDCEGQEMQFFYYAPRGMVPGLIFMSLVAWLAKPQGDVNWGLLGAIVLSGACAGFFGGAVLDKMERCAHQPRDEFHLAWLSLRPAVAGAVGVALGGTVGFALGQAVGCLPLAPVLALLGSALTFWLEGRNEAAPGRPRGGVLPTWGWLLVWSLLAGSMLVAGLQFKQEGKLP